MRILAATLAAAAMTLAATAPAQAVPVAVSTNDPCALSVTAPGPVDLISQAYLQCPGASPSNPLSVTMSVCAQNFRGFITGAPWTMAWESDGCRNWMGTIDDGLVPYTENDQAPCGPIPLYRGIVTATVAGQRMYAESETRAERPCP